MLKALRRHYAPCKRREWDQGYSRCACPVWIRGTLRGKRITVVASKFLPEPVSRDLQAARDLVLLWERSGAPKRPEESLAAPTPEQEVASPRPTVEMAVSAFLTDAQDRGNSEGTIYKKGRFFSRRFCFSFVRPREFGSYRNSIST